MKKFLVVLLALAMILAIASTAMAADTKIPDYNDTKTSTEYANDIYRLTALGVLEGNTGWGGAYRPADNLTRAEFAKIACFMFGKQSQVNYYKAQPSAFSDVEEGFWAEGWINCANDNGLMIGIGGGKFAPQANVTKQEVATVVLRAVGYTDELPGAWPADYIAKSQKVIAPFSSETLFDYVEIIDGTAATRAEMAAIVNYALDLYRVSYVGNQLMVQGISTADADGYTYKDLKTNEADIYNFFLGLDVTKAAVEIGPFTLEVDPNLTTRETLLWDVFHAIEVPYLFERWSISQCPIGGQYVEASGWGYEDFDKGELVFGDQLTKMIKMNYDGEYERIPFSELAQKEEAAYNRGSNDFFYYDTNPFMLPVASNYYIFDDSLDGELWQVGNRLANVTIQVDVSKAKIASWAKSQLMKGLEAVYVEMLSDVDYVDEETKVDFLTSEFIPIGSEVKVDNGDLFSINEDGFIGTNLNGNYDFYDYDLFQEDDIAIVEKVAKDKVTVDVPSFGEGGIFCTLDNCKTHDKNYIFLKDNKLQDATCLKVDDVIYYAGLLVGVAGEEIELYIAYTPKAATFDQLINNSGLKMNVSGTDYWFCDNDDAHAVSYDGGYASDGNYDEMKYAELKAKLTEEGYDGACLFTAGYGKKYVATIIFAAGETNRKYGVLVDFGAKHVYPEPDEYFCDNITMLGPDGEEVKETLDDDVWIGSSHTAPFAYFRQGWLFNYYLDEDGNVIYADCGKVYETGSDVGFVPYAPKAQSTTVFTNDKGLFKDAATLDGVVNTTGFDFDGMKITKDTVVYEITSNAYGFFKKAEVVKGEKYIDKEFTVQQMDIFECDGNEITVLYVVNPHFNGDVLLGLFNKSATDADGGFIEYTLDGRKVYFSADQGEGIPSELFYAAYKTQDDEVSRVHVWDAPNFVCPLEAGDLAMLYASWGPLMDPANIKKIILEYVDDAKDHKLGVAFGAIDPDLFADECEFIDLTGDGDFDADFFDVASHSTGDYFYAVTTDAYGEILQVFRFNSVPEGTTDSTTIPWITGMIISIPSDHAWWLND